MFKNDRDLERAFQMAKQADPEVQRFSEVVASYNYWKLALVLPALAIINIKLGPAVSSLTFIL